MSLWLTPLFLMGFFCTLVEDLFQKRRVPHCEQSNLISIPGSGPVDSVSCNLQDTGGLKGWVFHQLSIHATRKV